MQEQNTMSPAMFAARGSGGEAEGQVRLEGWG